ncbi:MAG: leucyl/phenylalanyl-tRNA--protein transferase [Candidatus Promineifilaceae bacterium]|nr:leucyl/phenylalanyl-tRNA--protein transferase [Candidatus Promineifilaceae bacterium]
MQNPMLAPEQLLFAYAQGVFPMADDDGAIYWYDPDPRAILPIDDFHTPARLARTVRQKPFEIRLDSAFRSVMEACATPAPGREKSWISPELVEAYVVLHRLGFAHSVEAWQDGRLVGGLYGVSINSFFAGESMFSHATDASKVALVHLVERLRQRQFQLLDIQFMTEHLRQFGAVEVPRAEYRRRLARALHHPTHFTSAPPPQKEESNGTQ